MTTNNESLERIDPAFGDFKDFAAVAVGTTRQLRSMRERVFADGAVPARLKTLTALVWSIAARCEPCVRYYAKQARETGASEAELGEMLAICSTMGGCVGETWALKAFHAFAGDRGTNGAECCQPHANHGANP